MVQLYNKLKKVFFILSFIRYRTSLDIVNNVIIILDELSLKLLKWD